MDETTRQEIVGRTLADPTGATIGTVSEVYLDDDTGEATWLRVSLGRVRTTQTMVPVAGAQLLGDSVRVPHDASVVEDAPRLGLGAHLPLPDVERLRRHYGLDGGPQPPLQDLRQSPGSVRPESGGRGAEDGPATASSRNPEAGEDGSPPGERSGS